MLHILVTKSLTTGNVVSERHFTDRATALDAFFMAEEHALRERPDLRPVLLNAESREAALATHAPCFGR